MSRRPLVLLLLLALCGCGVIARKVYDAASGTATPSAEHARWAKAAWAYFEKNRGPTGLAATVAGGWFTTPATIADQLAALVAARRLDVIEPNAFDTGMSQVLQFLNTMPLSAGGMPGKVYSTETGQLVDFAKRPADLGWSGAEAGRLLAWLRIAANRYPQYALYAVNAAARWNVCAVLDREGRLQGADVTDAGLQPYRDTEAGDAPYAAQGYRAWGLAVPPAKPPGTDATLDIYGRTFPLLADGAPAPPLLTAPYALLGIEWGWRTPDGAFLSEEHRRAQSLYDVQQARADETGILTARTAYRRAAEPYTVLDAVLAHGFPWGTTDAQGRARPDLALVATRAVFGLWALWTTPYTNRLLDRSDALFDPESGWLEGRYEKTGGYEWTRTAATNAFVLEALLHDETGTLFRSGPALPPTEPPRPGEDRSCRLPDLR